MKVDSAARNTELFKKYCLFRVNQSDPGKYESRVEKPVLCENGHPPPQLTQRHIPPPPPQISRLTCDGKVRSTFSFGLGKDDPCQIVKPVGRLDFEDVVQSGESEDIFVLLLPPFICREDRTSHTRQGFIKNDY